MNAPQVLIIDILERDDKFITSLSEKLRSQNVSLHKIIQPNAANWLRNAIRTKPKSIVILLNANIERPIPFARDLKSIMPSAHIVFMSKPEHYESLRRDLSLAPMIGSQWSLMKMDDSSSDIISDAIQMQQRRDKLRTTLDRANIQIDSIRHVDTADYRRLLISERYLASVLEGARDAIVGIDNQLQILYWNNAAEKIFGIPSREALIRKVDQLPFWSDAVQNALHQIFNGSNAPSAEITYTTSDVASSIEIGYSSVLDETGKIIGVSLIIRDISSRMRRLNNELQQKELAAKALNNERLRLLSLFEQSPGFMAVTRGPEHVLEMANRAYHRTFGERALTGRPIKTAFPELTDHPFFDIRDEVFATGKPYVGRETPVMVSRTLGEPAQQIFIDFVYQPILEADGSISGIFCQGNEVTEQKNMQDMLVQYQVHLEQLVADRTAELQQTEMALQQSQKLEAIGKLTGGVAHDFNNILHVIGGNLELLSLRFAKDDDASNRIKIAAKAVDRGAKLSSQLLAFARRQPLQPVSTSIGTVLRDLDDLLRRALGEAIEIETVVGGGLWTTMVDRNQLENVVLNLAINARDAMDGAGRLTLEVCNAMLDDLYTHQHADVPAGQYVVLSVSDTGYGMSSEVIERAFEPFFTTKPEGAGTGLGLSMAYGFVKQSGGHIKIYSELGHGTTIKVYLPRNYEAEAIVPDMRFMPAVGGIETILVVEDDPSVQVTVVDMLRELGYNVLKASEAAAALVILQSGVHVDLLFTDVVMPGPLRSTDLAKRAKELNPHIAVLFTSGYTQNAIVHGGRLDAGVELISKPYRRGDLARKIRHILANQNQVLETANSLVQMRTLPIPPISIRARQSILVVEDNLDAQEMLCELLGLLGYAVKGCTSAEQAVPMLSDIEILLTDINLPGMSGVELARAAISSKPNLKVIFVSGSDAPDGLGFKSELLRKPYSLQSLEEILPNLAG